MYITDPEDPRTEAQQVAEYEARNAGDKKKPRLSLHVNWDDEDEAEMLYCKAFRAMPRGMCRKVVLKFLDVLVGECRTHEQVVQIFNAWVRSKDAQARSALTGSAPADWQQAPTPRSTPQEAAEQRPMQQAEFYQRMRDAPAPPGMRWGLVANESALMMPRQAPAWEGETVPTKPVRQHPEPSPTPPPRRVPEQTAWSMDGL